MDVVIVADAEDEADVVCEDVVLTLGEIVRDCVAVLV